MISAGAVAAAGTMATSGAANMQDREEGRDDHVVQPRPRAFGHAGGRFDVGRHRADAEQPADRSR